MRNVTLDQVHHPRLLVCNISCNCRDAKAAAARGYASARELCVDLMVRRARRYGKRYVCRRSARHITAWDLMA